MYLVLSLQTLIEDEPEKYQTHFSLYAKKGIDADNIEELYKKVHAAIRADPTVKKSDKQPPKQHKRYAELASSTSCYFYATWCNFFFLVNNSVDRFLENPSFCLPPCVLNFAHTYFFRMHNY